MAEYSSLKVPELKKLLAEKGLSQTGNKAELVARLKENDEKSAPEEEKPAENKEDEISYSDDEGAAPTTTTDAKPAAPAADAGASEPTDSAAATTDAAEKPAEPETEAKPVGEEAAAPAQNFALGLSSTTADEEAKKRADRAKRFGLEENDDATKRADRAQRFGIDEKTLASSLDSALPERSLKRGRGRGEADGNRPGKRQSLDRRGGGRRSERNRRDGPSNDNRAGNSGGNKRSILEDPAEKAKAEKRAARFASN